MTATTGVHLAVEDVLSEEVARKIVTSFAPSLTLLHTYGKKGVGYLRSQMRSFAAASRITPFLVFVDLDRTECAPTLRQEMLPAGASQQLLLRVAVREIEAWLVADDRSLARLLAVPRQIIERQPETLPDPKRYLLGLIKRSRHATLRRALLPRDNTKALVGPSYNHVFGEFVRDQWDPSRAAARAPSLARTLAAIGRLIERTRSGQVTG